jgi:hypothetical protein
MSNQLHCVHCVVSRTDSMHCVYEQGSVMCTSCVNDTLLFNQTLTPTPLLGQVLPGQCLPALPSSACPVNCSQCVSYPVSGGTILCVSCMEDNRLSEGACIPIQPCPENCTDCFYSATTGNAVCTMCEIGTVLIDNSCIPGDCPENCSTCQNITFANETTSFCSSCVSDEFTLSGSECRYVPYDHFCDQC